MKGLLTDPYLAFGVICHDRMNSPVILVAHLCKYRNNCQIGCNAHGQDMLPGNNMSTDGQVCRRSCVISM